MAPFIEKVFFFADIFIFIMEIDIVNNGKSWKVFV